MANCKVVVVGCNHGIQPEGADELFGDSEQVSQQKKQFAKLIENLIKANEIEFIGEEWGLANKTSAHALADTNKKSWANINTTPQELDAMKIPRGYIDGAYPPEQKQQWSRQREAVMLKKVMESKAKATRYLVVCGFEHMEPLAEGLKQDCNTIEIIDYRQREWYQAGVFAE